MVREARDSTVWMIQHLDDVRGHNLADIHGKAAAAVDMVDVLLAQPPVARAEYVRVLAAKLGVGEREVRQTLNEVVRDRGDYYRQHPEERPTVSARPADW
jgi:hypothetical protein